MRTNNNEIKTLHHDVDDSDTEDSAICITTWDMPRHLRTPYIISGYRKIHQPWSYYVKGIFFFKKNYEFLNVWSHVIGFLLVLAFFWHVILDKGLADDRIIPLYTSLVTMMIMFFASSIAHLFSHKSVTVNCVFFIADISAVGLYGYGTAVNHYNYSASEVIQQTALYRFAIPICALLAVLVSISGGLSKAVFTEPHSRIRTVLMVTSIGMLYYLSNIPVFYRLTHEVWTDGHWFHAKQIFYFHLTGFFFCSRVPERLCPGKFDVVGNSHQMFHVIMVLCTESHIKGILWDISNNHLPSHDTFSDPMLLLLYVIVIDFVIVFCFYLVLIKLSKKSYNSRD